MSLLSPVVLERPTTPPDAGSLQRLLAGLYDQQIALEPDNPYLPQHATPAGIRDHVRNFEWYRRFLPFEGAILDWGCNHAPDSCLLRAACGDRFDLHGCDFAAVGRFGVFHDYAGLKYRRLLDPFVLPYEASRFDAVIGSGVLEHTAMDYRALEEVWRVLRPGGLLVITYLPNRLSVQEWFRRSILKTRFHRRRYGLGEASQLLKRCGFYPFQAGYQASGVMAVWPLRVFSSTLRLVARKRLSM